MNEEVDSMQTQNKNKFVLRRRKLGLEFFFAEFLIHSVSVGFDHGKAWHKAMLRCRRSKFWKIGVLRSGFESGSCQWGSIRYSYHFLSRILACCVLHNSRKFIYLTKWDILHLLSSNVLLTYDRTQIKMYLNLSWNNKN